jgi:hypothetical protein
LECVGSKIPSFSLGYRFSARGACAGTEDTVEERPDAEEDRQDRAPACAGLWSLNDEELPVSMCFLRQAVLDIAATMSGAEPVNVSTLEGEEVDS